MRYCSPGVIVATVWLSLLPSIVRADDLADARNAMQKGDLRAAQIDLRNAVRSDPQNAETHYWLGRVSLISAIRSQQSARRALRRTVASIRIWPCHCSPRRCWRNRSSTIC